MIVGIGRCDFFCHPRGRLRRRIVIPYLWARDHNLAYDEGPRTYQLAAEGTASSTVVTSCSHIAYHTYDILYDILYGL